MKTGPDKVALRIHRSSYGRPLCSLASPAPGTAAKFRRWNVVWIAILAFVVLGALVAAEAPRTANDSNAPLRENTSPAAVQHANSGKSPLPPIHGRSGSGRLSNDVTGGHHTS